MQQSPQPSSYPSPRAGPSRPWPLISGDRLRAVHEPLRLELDFGRRATPRTVMSALCAAACGPIDRLWEPPGWLQHHQRDAARRIRGSLRAFNGALLADAVGLGKTYVALAVARGYRNAVAVVPAVLRPQWQRTCRQLGIDVSIVTHESLSRAGTVPAAELIIVDEAHRMRNPATRRYDRLARGVRHAHVLLLSATPVVNRAADLVHLLRLFAADDAFSLFGVSSLERALARHAYDAIALGTSPVVVARSAKAIAGRARPLPAARDGCVIRAAPVTDAVLRPVLEQIDRLEFPAFGKSPEAELLRVHLLYRLASSAVACRETVRRHLAYAERASAAAERGERLSRATARQVFRTADELQLDLGDYAPADSVTPASRAALSAERNRLRHLLDLLGGDGAGPKAGALRQLLGSRSGGKTIVFTAALATALEIARIIKWQRTAVVGAGRAWIASGPIAVEDALSLFAPRARGAEVPRAAEAVSTLVATDLASEGLDLQDADAIVHYDLPWTPLRLEQRTGRIVRLGARHPIAHVWWFAPHPAIEKRLHLEKRLARKVRHQLGLGVATTSRVGRARVINQTLEHRETLASRAATIPVIGPCHAVVRGPPVAAVAVVWQSGSREVPELLLWREGQATFVRDFGAIRGILDSLASAQAKGAHAPAGLVDAVAALLRNRLAGSARGPVDRATRRLCRAIVRRGHGAARARRLSHLVALDAALSRVQSGLGVGAVRELTDALRAGPTGQALSGWLAANPLRSTAFPRVRVSAALFGDGSRADSIRVASASDSLRPHNS